MTTEPPKKANEQGNEDRFGEWTLAALERLERQAILAGWTELEFWDAVENAHAAAVTKIE